MPPSFSHVDMCGYLPTKKHMKYKKCQTRQLGFVIALADLGESTVAVRGSKKKGDDVKEKLGGEKKRGDTCRVGRRERHVKQFTCLSGLYGVKEFFHILVKGMPYSDMSYSRVRLQSKTEKLCSPEAP